MRRRCFNAITAHQINALPWLTWVDSRLEGQAGLTLGQRSQSVTVTGRLFALLFSFSKLETALKRLITLLRALSNSTAHNERIAIQFVGAADGIRSPIYCRVDWNNWTRHKKRQRIDSFGLLYLMDGRANGTIFQIMTPDLSFLFSLKFQGNAFSVRNRSAALQKN